MPIIKVAIVCLRGHTVFYAKFALCKSPLRLLPVDLASQVIHVRSLRPAGPKVPSRVTDRL